MSIGFNLFPTLNEDLLSKIRFQPRPYEFSYNKNNELIPLQKDAINGNDNFSKLSDENGIWNPDEYNFNFKREYALRSFSCLFGKDGLVCRNAEIGLAIMWTSKSSKLRGVIEVGTIYNNQVDEILFSVEKSFDVAMLRGQINLKTIIYVKKSGNPNLKEEHLANTEGYILGVLDEDTIVLDGNGSLFPIFEVYEPNQPLWYVRCDWDDPTSDLFAENVSININKAHNSFIKYLDPSKKAYYNEQLLKEVMASALMIIIYKLRDSEYWNQTVSGEDFDKGSVSEAVYYFINTLQWDISSPERLSLSIREFFDDRM